MKGIYALLLILSLVSAGFSNTRILLVGDSITEGVGSSDGLGFRDEVRNRLLGIGYPFEFVGFSGNDPYRGHFQRGAVIGDFYRGIGGNGSFHIASNMDVWQPHVVMIHLGTNDVGTLIAVTPYTSDGGTTFTMSISGRLAHLVAYLLEWKDGRRGDHLDKICISCIIEVIGRESKVYHFNEEIKRIFEDSEAGRIPSIPPGSLILMDHYSEFEPSTMLTGDGIHPNDLGYTHLTEGYIQALRYRPMHIVRVSDQEQRGVSGHPLGLPLTVRVTNDYGQGIEGMIVSFGVSEGDAQILGSGSAITDGSGEASTGLQLGGLGFSTIVARCSGLTDSLVSFTVESAAGIRITGQTTYYSGARPIPDVRLQWVEEPVTVDTTDSGGSYRFDEFPYGERLTIRPIKERWSSVTASPILSYDAALIARGAMGYVALSPEEMITGDADGDGRITMGDASHIARHVVGFGSNGSTKVGQWKFSPDFLTWEGLTHDLSEQNFTGFLIGDVHGGWNETAQMMKTEDSGIRVRCLPAQITEDVLKIPVQIEGCRFISCDLVCHFDPGELEYIGTEKTAGAETFHLLSRMIGERSFRIGMYGTEYYDETGPVLLLRFRMREKRGLTLISFEDVYVNATVLDAWSCPIETATPAGLVSFQLMQNYPNPFNEGTVISFTLSNRSRIRLEIFNSLGQRITCLEDGEREAGSHSIRWNGSDHLGISQPSGIYFYTLTDRESRKVGKMEIVR